MVAEEIKEPEEKVAGPRSAVLYLIGSLVQGLGLLLVQPFAIRLLNPVEWGLVSTSIVAIQVVVVLISAGLPLAITRLWFDATDGQRRARAMYGFLALGALALGALAAAGTIVAALAGGGPVPWPAVLAMLSIGLLGTVLGGQAVLRAQNRPLAFVALSLISSVAANVAGLATILLTAATATAYLAAYSIAVAAATAVAVLLIRPLPPWRVRGVMRESGGIALPLLPHTGALMLLTQGAVLLLAVLAGAAPAGQYGAVLIFALGPLTLLNALNNAWATRLMGAPRGQLLGLVKSVTTEALLAAGAIGLLASAAATAGSFVLTQAPEELSPVARILPLVSLGYALFLVATNVVYILERTRAMAAATPVVLVVVGAAALPFALRADLVAVAAVHAAGFILLGLAYWGVVRGETRGAWPLRLFGGVLAAHLAAVAILTVVPTTFLAGVIEAGLAVVLVAAAGYLRLKGSRSPARV